MQNDFFRSINLDMAAHPGTRVAVPHNLQPMQPEFHDYILNNI